MRVLSLLLAAPSLALVPPQRRAQPRRPAAPRAATNEVLDIYLEERPAAQTFYDAVEDGKLAASYAGESPPDPELEDQKKISALVDFMHTELMTLSTSADYVDDEAPLGDEFDDFLEEGRKMLAITQSRVCGGESEADVAEGVWAALGELFREEAPDTGLLCALPDFSSDVKTFVQCEVVAPLTLMGFGKRIEARPYTTDRGAPFPAFRILVEPSTVPEDDSQPE